jgi:hypothetical protein
MPSTEEDLRSVLGWRRTGLVFGWGAVASAAAALVGWLVDRDQPSVAVAILVLAGFLVAVIALGFLRRAWSVPGVADGHAVVRARRCADVAVIAWGVAVVFRFVVVHLLDLGGTWSDVVRGVLGTVAVAAYVGMLVLTTWWRPVRAGQL